MNSNKTLLLCRVGFSSHRRRGRRCLFVLCFFSSARRRDFFSALPQLDLLLHDSHSRFLYYALLWLEYFPPRICRIHFIIAQNEISIVCAKLQVQNMENSFAYRVIVAFSEKIRIEYAALNGGERKEVVPKNEIINSPSKSSEMQDSACVHGAVRRSLHTSDTRASRRVYELLSSWPCETFN